MAAAVTVGVFLKGLFDGVNDVIQNAGNVGKDVLIEAGIQTRRTIEQAQVCYESMLNTTMDRVDETARLSLNKLKVLTDGVIAGQKDVIDGARLSSQQIINSLLFNDRANIPQLLTASPRFVSATAKTVHFVFKGNFLQASKPEFPAVLKFDPKESPPTSVETQKLEVELPFEDVFETRVLDAIGRSRPGFLVLPYKAPPGLIGAALGGVATPPATFSIFVRSLPESPGKMTLKSRTVHKRIEEQTIEKGRYLARVTGGRDGGHYDQAWHLCSCSKGDCESTTGHQPTDSNYRGKNDDEERTFTVVPTAGAVPPWQIRPGSSSCHLEELQGTPDPTSRSRDDITGVSYWVKTRVYHVGTSASVNVNIRYTEERFPIDTVDKDRPIELKWGESRAYLLTDLEDPCNSGGKRCIDGCKTTWKLVFKDFRDITHEFVTDGTSDYINVQTGAGVTIKVPALKDLKEFS